MLFQSFDDEHTRPGCVFHEDSEPGAPDTPPPGPEDVKHFDILEFVKEQENEGADKEDNSVPEEVGKDSASEN